MHPSVLGHLLLQIMIEFPLPMKRLSTKIIIFPFCFALVNHSREWNEASSTFCLFQPFLFFNNTWVE
jgi:hypothetical protein